jgi:chromosomal replication initiation ATPase DnaA
MTPADEISGRSTSGSGLTYQEEWHPLLIGAKPNPSMTMATFRGGKTNQRIVELMQKISSGVASASPLIFIHAEPGLGKTHLLSAVAADSALSARLIPVADLEAEIIRAKRQGALAECYQWLFAHDMLLLDGIDHTTDNEVFESDLIHILDRMNHSGKVTILTSCRPPHRLSVSHSKLSSLLLCGMILEIKICEEEERFQILRDTFEKDALPDEVARYVAKNVTDSIRHLKAAAQQITAISDQSGTPSNLEMARAVVPLPEDLRHTPAALTDTVSAETDGNSLLVSNKASFFREMLSEAETEAEQALALQIALSQRIRELRSDAAASASVAQLEQALELLREGHLREAMARVNR